MIHLILCQIGMITKKILIHVFGLELNVQMAKLFPCMFFIFYPVPAPLPSEDDIEVELYDMQEFAESLS